MTAVYSLQDYFYIVPDVSSYSDENLSAEEREAFLLYRKVAADFKTGAALTRIFAGPLATQALDEYERRINLRASKPPHTRGNQALQDLATLHEKLLRAAKIDLGV